MCVSSRRNWAQGLMPGGAAVMDNGTQLQSQFPARPCPAALGLSLPPPPHLTGRLCPGLPAPRDPPSQLSPSTRLPAHPAHKLLESEEVGEVREEGQAGQPREKGRGLAPPARTVPSHPQGSPEHSLTSCSSSPSCWPHTGSSVHPGAPTYTSATAPAAAAGSPLILPSRVPASCP